MLPQGWAELVALLDGQPNADPISRFQRLCGLCVQATGVTGAELSVANDGARSTVSSTDDVAERLQVIQDTVGEGPRHDAMTESEAVLVADLAEVGHRWPAFAPAAAEAGVQAVFVLPLRMGAAHLGVLSLYRTEPGPLSEEALRDTRILAEAVGLLLMLAQAGGDAADAFVWVLGDQSRFRPEVHQAVGAIMVQLDLGPRDAFARLCAHAYTTGTAVGVVAGQILDKRLRLEPDAGR